MRIIPSKLIVMLLGFIILIACGDSTISVNNNNNDGDSGGGGQSFYERCPPDDASTLVLHQNIDHLIITEFSPMTAINRSVWFEVFNPTPHPIQLANIQLKSYAIVSDQEPSPNDIDWTPNLFNLPQNTLEPYGHLLIESVISKRVKYRYSKPEGDVESTELDLGKPINTEHYIRLANHNKTFFWRHDSGMIELIDKQTGTTIDFIHFGSDTQLPTSTSQWLGDAIPIYQHPKHPTSIARITPYQDHNKASDWSLSTFQTPTGENLTFPMVAGKMDLTLNTSNVDLDKDGIPDSKEVDCAYFNGLPYYGWGARPNQTDIFVQVDYMQDNPSGTVPDLMKPSYAALKKWEDIYINHSPTDLNHASGPLYPIRLHLDTGTLHANDGEHNKINTSRYNLYATNTTRRGGSTVTFKQTTSLGTNAPIHAGNNMDPRRDGIFHYMLVAYTKSLNSTTVGIADLNGSNSLVYLGNRDRLSSLNDRGEIDTLLASTAAHEVGHNLSLRHGGFEDNNYKPNYYSIMNYGYSDDMVRSGLEHTPAEIKTIKDAHVYACSGDNSYFRFYNYDLKKAYYNFSNGTGHDINLSAIDESQQYLNEDLGLMEIDYDNSGSIDTNMSCRIANFSTTKTLKDSNDWIQTRDGAVPWYKISYASDTPDGLPVAEPDEIIECGK